jgi:hypothetical protein
MIHRSYYAGEVKRVGVNAIFAKQTSVRASRRAIESASDSLRYRTAKLCGISNMNYREAWTASNVGVSLKHWNAFISGNRLPEKYHRALAAFLLERGA